MSHHLSAALPEETLKNLSHLIQTPFEILNADHVLYFKSGNLSAQYFEKNLEYENKTIAILRSDHDPQFLFQILSDYLSKSIRSEFFEFESEHRKLQIQQIQNIAQKLSNLLEAKTVVQTFTHEIQSLFQVERISVFLIENDKQLSLIDAVGTPIEDTETAQYICYSGKSVLSHHPKTDPRFLSLDGNSRSEVELLNNIMAAPIVSAQKTLGTIYLANRNEGAFSSLELQILQSLAQILGNSLKQIETHKLLLESAKVRSQLERYLSPNIVRTIAADSQITETWKGSKVHATVLFSDIRGFTKITERLEPEILVAQLNEYFEEMAKIIFSFDGTLDKFVGDMIMAVFGAPTAFPDSSTRAVKSAIHMQKKLKSLNEKWKAENREIFEMGIGINSGPMIFGNIGSKRAMGITVIGDPVNIAHRLQSVAKAGEILLSNEVIQTLPKTHGFKTEALGEFNAKGKIIHPLRLHY